MEQFKPYQTDHLMLLVGTNPLPNYVAARLLAHDKTRLHLVVTREVIQKDHSSPKNVTERLKELLSENRFEPDIIVEESDPEQIFDQVHTRITNKN